MLSQLGGLHYHTSSPSVYGGAGQKKSKEALGEGEVPGHSDLWKS